MAETKHTPGPWASDIRLGETIVRGACSECVSLLPHSAAQGFGLTDIREIEANARLIAAAPEMLEALLAMTGLGMSGNQQLAALHKARAAIAKAEGRS